MTDILKNHREDLLKAEIATLLFNLGKTHAGISNWKDYISGVTPQFSSYKDYFKNSHFIDELNNVDSTGKLKYFFENNSFVTPDKTGKFESVSLISCMQAGESDTEFVKRVMFRGCENINSGIDKGALPDTQQIKGELYISNAFGTHKEDVDRKWFDKKRLCFFQRLHQEMLNKDCYDNPDWIRIRNFIFNEIRSWYSHLLSDNRFPANDVTLWDQAYMTASMFKAVLAEMYMGHNQENYINNPQKIRWQILGIQYDKLALAEKGAKPAFIHWYREKTNELDNKIKNYFETELAIANEIYRDETGIYFLFPNNSGEKFKHKENQQVLKKDFPDLETTIINLFYKHFPGEIYPAIFLTKPCRGLMNLTQLLTEAKDNFLYAPYFLNRNDQFVFKNITGSPKKSAVYPQICHVCRMRMAESAESGKTEDDLHFCEICKKRKEGRLSEWLNNRNCETIWLDELQDKNSRIALITLRFELNEWLNGNMLSTCITQLFQEGDNFKSLLDNLSRELKNSRTKNINKSCIKKYRGDIPNQSIEELLYSFLFDRAEGSRWEGLIEEILNNYSTRKKINFDENLINWDELTQDDIRFLSVILHQFLLRKNPSPPRLRRLWESTQKFADDLQREISEKQQTKRLVFNVDNWRAEWEEEEENVGGLLYYFHKEKAYLLTSLQKAWLRIRKNSGKKYSDFKKEGFNNWEDWIQRIPQINTDTLGKIQLSNQHLEDYTQIFSIIDPTPISWQFAVPAEAVPEIIEKVQESYQKEFKYVHGKLPLHIGFVVQNYKSPLYVGLNALRNIRRELDDWEDIKKTLKATEFPEEYEYGKTDDERINNPPDYYALFQHNGEGEYSFYFPSEKETVSVSKLEPDKEYRYYPNTIDFEYLDCNTRRNDIYYKKGKRTAPWREKRPYDWRYWERFEKFRELFGDSQSNQLHNLITLLYSLLEDWKGESESIQKLAGSAIINTLKPKNMKAADQERLSDIFGVDKWNEIREKITVDLLYEFIDMYDFYHKTLKEV